MADILVIEDDQNLGFSLRTALVQAGHGCRWVECAQSAAEACRTRVPDLALVDLCLPDGSGLDLIESLHATGLRFPIIIMTAFGTVNSAVAALKKGAADFIEKPQSVAELCRLADEFIENRRLLRDLEGGEPDSPTGCEATGFIGACPGIREVLNAVERIASLPAGCTPGILSVLVLGETGTGKEVLARRIHGQSRLRQGSFVHVNCNAIPEHLLEAEFFGHEKGSFTDAKARKDGLFVAALGGTLFLDEVGDMPLPMQSKLLVAIETGRFRPVGSSSERTVDTQVIAATNCNLERKAVTGEFRSDLYHRLSMFSIELPPLRERGDDILLLANHFLERLARRLGRSTPSLSSESAAALRAHGWPGNVRELAHVLLRALTMDSGVVIKESSLNLPKPGSSTRAMTEPLTFDFASGDCTFESMERKLLQMAMERANRNVTRAARLLGMTRGTLRYRLEKLKIDVDDAGDDAD